MTKLKTLIAEDEAPARQKMVRLLQQFDNLEIINISENGLDAFNNIIKLTPDVVFLDIEMPGMTGLEVVQSLPEEVQPYIIFATAYNEHAIKAFELNAVDYLLKPFNLDRLKQTVEKIEKLAFPADNSPVRRAVEQLQDTAAPINKIPVPAADRYKLIDYDEIVCIEVEERAANIYTINKVYPINQTLEKFEEKLPTSQFFRVSRSCIINVHAIQEIVLWFGNRYKIVLTGGKEVISSRERSRALKNILKF